MSLHGYSDDGYVYDSDNDNVTRISRLDVSHPLHLHPNDSAALTVVSIKLKGTENYQVWSCAMLLALEGKNKTGFIDGTCRRSNTDEVLGRQWEIRNSNQRPQSSGNTTRPSNVTRPSTGNRRSGGGSQLVCENYGFNGHTIDSKIFNQNFNKFFCNNNRLHDALVADGLIVDSGANQHLTYDDSFEDNEMSGDW
ncbi:ribonuclease H-like domain-containing protein [Tanacetum coccineum]